MLKKSQKSLKQWTRQDWGTKSGKPSTQGPKATGERYLPASAIKALSPSEYASTTAAKRKGTAAGKVEEKKAQAKTRVAKAEAEAIVMQKKATGEIDWDLEMAKGSQSSWKDEWLTVLFSIPLVLAFIPGMEEVVKNGFARLNEMPEWYQYSLGVIVAASFGVRSATKFFGKK